MALGGLKSYTDLLIPSKKTDDSPETLVTLKGNILCEKKLLFCHPCSSAAMSSQKHIQKHPHADTVLHNTQTFSANDTKLKIHFLIIKKCDHYLSFFNCK